MIYGVYARRQRVRNASDTVYTARHFFLVILSGLYFPSARVRFTYMDEVSADTQREDEKINRLFS